MRSKCGLPFVSAPLTLVRRCNLSLFICLVTLGVTMADASGDDESDTLHILGQEIAAGTRSKFSLMPDISFEASYLNMPVFIARGSTPGPTLCLTAGVHGDELNGVEIARRSFSQVELGKLRGTMIALPAINASGVRAGNRYLSDRRDLNRAFPGRAGGSIAALIAHSVFTKVLIHCDAILDLHTASNQRANLPQIRADLSDPAIRELAIHFGIGIIIGEPGVDGSLRREAVRAGIPTILYEAGEPYRFQEDEIARGVKGVENVMAYLDMTRNPDREIPGSRIYERSTWIRAAAGNSGFFFPHADLGDAVRRGELLGKIIDPFTDETFEVTSPRTGQIVGMAVPQPVLSGYALFHLAWRESN